MKPSRLKLFFMWLLGFYPKYCDWYCRGEKFLGWTETKGTSGMCEECEMTLMIENEHRKAAKHTFWDRGAA